MKILKPGDTGTTWEKQIDCEGDDCGAQLMVVAGDLDYSPASWPDRMTDSSGTPELFRFTCPCCQKIQEIDPPAAVKRHVRHKNRQHDDWT